MKSTTSPAPSPCDRIRACFEQPHRQGSPAAPFIRLTVGTLTHPAPAPLTLGAVSLPGCRHACDGAAKLADAEAEIARLRSALLIALAPLQEYQNRCSSLLAAHAFSVAKGALGSHFPQVSA